MMTPYTSDKPVVLFDLDDTLYKEIDYLHSAYREISNYLNSDKHISDNPYPHMIEWYNRGENVFYKLNAYYGLNIPIDYYLTLYRFHMPKIKMDASTEQTLSYIKERGCGMGIITDGRSITQRNKILSLGLERFFPMQNIIISDDIGSQKPDKRNFSIIQQQFPEQHFIYVGDNIEKDFITPNKLGWKTICLLDDGRNIHKQDFSLPTDYLPHISVDRIDKIINYL